MLRNNLRLYLLMSDGCLFLIGQLHQRADVRPKVRLATNKENTSTGAKVEDLSPPLQRQKYAILR